MVFRLRLLPVAVITVLPFQSEYDWMLSQIHKIHLQSITICTQYVYTWNRSGAVFGWGKNTFGQIGIGNESARYYPTHLKTMRSIGVRKVSAGEDFSVFLTIDGGVFSCGAGTFGQLGHGDKNNVSLPRMVVEMMGTQVTQISCGNRHTLTYVPSRNRIYGFGLNSSGQLGSFFNFFFSMQYSISFFVRTNG